MIQSLICDFRDSKAEDIDYTILLKYIDEKVIENGTIWIFSNNKYSNETLKIQSFDICSKLQSLYLKNIILIYKKNTKKNNYFFNDNVEHILFFSKSKKFFINKDPIREKHIWKDVEWGKRKKNYNPKGKDPGNLWIKTDDDGKGKITKHIPLDENESIERIIKCSSKEHDNIATYKINIINSHNRNINEEQF